VAVSRPTHSPPRQFVYTPADIVSLLLCGALQEEREGEIRFAEGNVMSWDDVSRNVQDAIELVGTMSLGSASHVLGTPLVRALSNEQRPQHGPNALPKAAWR
jgi:hypothetical protein